MKLILAVALFAAGSLGVAQTAAVAPQAAKGTCAIPAQPLTITVPKSGGKVSFTIPAATAPATVAVPGQTAPVDVSGYTGSLSCSLSPTGSFVINPDKSITVTGLVCSLAKTQ